MGALDVGDSFVGRERPRARLTRRWFARVEWKPEDCWVGAFWRTTRPWARGEGPATALDVWVCVLPIIPLHFGWKAAITHG